MCRNALRPCGLFENGFETLEHSDRKVGSFFLQTIAIRIGTVKLRLSVKQFACSCREFAMTTRLLISSLITFCICLVFIGQSTFAQTATVDFESLASGTQFGGSAGLTDSPGDLVFSENGVDVRVDNFTLGVFTGFNSVSINNDMASNVAFVNNIVVDFDPSGLPGPVTGASFTFNDFGGDENLVVNGNRVEVSNFGGLPAVIGGVNVSAMFLPVGALRGTVTLDGPINSLGIGGQELQIDDVQFRYIAVPEPSACFLLIGLAGTAIGRRRRLHA